MQGIAREILNFRERAAFDDYMKMTAHVFRMVKNNRKVDEEMRRRKD